MAWIKQRTRTILAAHNQLVTQSKRYNITRDESSVDLHISGVRRDDNGLYICQITANPMKNLVRCISRKLLLKRF